MLSLGNAFFEEDFRPINTDWYTDSKKMLDSGQFIYIGEHTPAADLNENYKCTKRVLNDNRTSDGYNFSDIYKKYN